MEIDVTDNNFKEEVLESSIPVLVDFWAPWCMPCKMVAPSVAAIAQEFDGKLKVCKVNVDEASETATMYKIVSIPTLCLFKDGEVADQLIGALPKADIETMIKPHIA
ncbi:MAG: thioredoxin [Spirochaetales bacterium]|nr:thioredoxin [Spirochaetales bacterium]